MTPFDCLNAINQSKTDLTGDIDFKKAYDAYVVNRGLSYFFDTCLYANEMNARHWAPREWQFSYLLNSITRKKRFSKWHKQDAAGDDLTMVMKYYDYSRDKARVALTVLTKEQLDMIKQKFEKGGKL